LKSLELIKSVREFEPVEIIRNFGKGGFEADCAVVKSGPARKRSFFGKDIRRLHMVGSENMT